MLFMDGFDYYAGGGNDQSGSIWDPDPEAFGTGAAGAYGYGRYATSNQAYKTLGVNAGTLYAGFHIYLSGVGTDSYWVFQFNDGATLQVGFRIDASNYLKAYRASGSNLLAIASAPIVSTIWHWLSIKVVFHGSAGSVDVMLDGASIISVPNINTIATANAYANKIGGFRYSGGSSYVDNFHVYDGTDAAPFDGNMLAERRIYTFVPTGNSAVDVGWTESTGDKWECMNEIPPNDTDYISSSTPGAKYGFTTADLGTGLVPVAVKLSAYARKDDAGTRTLRVFNKQVGYNVGDTETLLSGNKYLQKQWLADPEGGSWSRDKVNASEWGVELVA